MALPRIRLYGYMFHGLFTATELRRFERRPGVYIVTCACHQDSYDIEIGDTAEVQSYLLTHFARRKGCACPNKKARGPVYYAAFYCPEGGKHDRKELVAKIRNRAGVEA